MMSKISRNFLLKSITWSKGSLINRTLATFITIGKKGCKTSKCISDLYDKPVNRPITRSISLGRNKLVPEPATMGDYITLQQQFEAFLKAQGISRGPSYNRTTAASIDRSTWGIVQKLVTYEGGTLERRRGDQQHSWILPAVHTWTRERRSIHQSHAMPRWISQNMMAYSIR